MLEIKITPTEFTIANAVLEFEKIESEKVLKLDEEQFIKLYETLCEKEELTTDEIDLLEKLVKNDIFKYLKPFEFTA